MKWKKERKEERNRSAEISQVRKTKHYLAQLEVTIFKTKVTKFSSSEVRVMPFPFTLVKSAVYNWYGVYRDLDR